MVLMKDSEGTAELSNTIPPVRRLRRNFSFWPGKKSMVNRTYHSLVDRWLPRRYRLADYFFDLTQCIEGKKLDRVAALAKSSNVEVMTHPTVSAEEEYRMRDEFQVILQCLQIGGYKLV
jgi:hypothetical protein